jgi:hypothetical protein
MSTERSGRDDKTGVATGTGAGATAHTPHLGEFDREINVRGIVWSGIVLVAIALVVQLLMWWLLRGFNRFDEKRDVRLTPIETAMPQQPPPEPRLQVSPNDAMRRMREEEQRLLERAAWVNRQEGTVRVPIDVAIDVIVARGVSPLESVSPSASPSPPQPSSPQGRGGSAAEQRPDQVPLSPSGREGSGE